MDLNTASSVREAWESSNPTLPDQRMWTGVTIGIPIHRGKPFLEDSLANPTPGGMTIH